MKNLIKRYEINEIFYSVQGEGRRMGIPAVFVRFSGCNMRCNREEQGFDCDTAHSKVNLALSQTELLQAVKKSFPRDMLSCAFKPMVVLTGGEPALQLTNELLSALKAHYFICIETNGTVPLPEVTANYVTVSPKLKSSKMQLLTCEELRWTIPSPAQLPNFDLPQAMHYCLSPQWRDGRFLKESVDYAFKIATRYPFNKDHRWTVTLQMHKVFNYR